MGELTLPDPTCGVRPRPEAPLLWAPGPLVGLFFAQVAVLLGNTPARAVKVVRWLSLVVSLPFRSLAQPGSTRLAKATAA